METEGKQQIFKYNYHRNPFYEKMAVALFFEIF